MLERATSSPRVARPSQTPPDPPLYPSQVSFAIATDEAGAKAVDFAKGSPMPEVIFTGPAGRLEGRYHPAKQKNAPIAMVLHPHPQFHGTMNHQIIYQCYYAFAHRGFSVLRFNFRGVGRSQGSFDHGTGELSDAASALDWAQTINPEARACWVAGFSFGAWIGMQLLMRRPEVEGFISIAPPANLYDFSFLAPCPSSGLIVHGEKDAVVPPKDVNTLVEKLKTQKGIVIDQQIIPGANHFFDGKLEPLMQTVTGYLDMRLANVPYALGTAMTSFVALWRAVNVGGTGKLPMSDLKDICEELGFGTVRTYIASGNVVFKSRKSEAAIKSALEKRLEARAGKPIGVLVRTAAEMAQVLADNPFPKAAPNRAMAVFLDRAPPADTLTSIRGRKNE